MSSTPLLSGLDWTCDVPYSKS